MREGWRPDCKRVGETAWFQLIWAEAFTQGRGGLSYGVMAGLAGFLDSFFLFHSRFHLLFPFLLIFPLWYRSPLIYLTVRGFPLKDKRWRVWGFDRSDLMRATVSEDMVGISVRFLLSSSYLTSAFLSEFPNSEVDSNCMHTTPVGIPKQT